MLRSYIRGVRSYGNRGEYPGWNRTSYPRNTGFPTEGHQDGYQRPYQRTSTYQQQNSGTYRQQPPTQYGSRPSQTRQYAEKPQIQQRVRKPVTSNTLSFQAAQGGRIRISYDASRVPNLTLVLEEEGTRSYISYGLSQEAVHSWLENYTQPRPQILPDNNEVTAKVGSADDKILVQLASKEKTVNVAIELGQAKLIDAFLKWTQE